MQTEIERAEKNVTSKDSFFKNKKRMLIIGVCLLLVCVFGAITALAANFAENDKIYPNISCEGIDLSGLTAEEAAKKLEEEYLPKLNEKEFNISLYDWKLENIEKSAKVTAKDLQVEPDFELIAKAAYQQYRNGNIYKRYLSYLSEKKKGGLKIAMVGKMNEAKISSIIDELTDGIDTTFKETTYSVKNDVFTLKKGHGGQFIDKEKSKSNIESGVFSLADEIKLFVDIKEHKERDLDELYNEITNSKKDAYYEKVDGQVVVVDEFPKVEISKQALKEALESPNEVIEIPVKTEIPEVTGDELRAMLFRDNMGSWTSNFSSSNVPRSSNVRLTASRINGIVLMPGEVFSYDNTIGRRTAANGYKVAGVYVGNKVEEGIGGGICQTSSTLYSAVLYSNLEIVTRTSHSLPVSYMPAGQDATIAEGYIDFKFRNNTDYPIKIVCEAGQRTVTCKILGVKPKGQSVEIVNTITSRNEPKLTRETDEAIPVGYKKITQKGEGGYNVSSVRIVKMNGVEQKRENLTKSVYRATDTIEVVNPADKDTPTDALSIYDENNPVEANPESKPVSGEATGETPQAEKEETEEVKESQDEEKIEIITEEEQVGEQI